jgi:1-aminocyclopropane-1-carboxylate deaminase/D-cysteine desulfhydrase-like pyridoxal-dependent ACC family enzyme
MTIHLQLHHVYNTRLGSQKLVASVCNDIRRKRKHDNPYPIPVGGSNGIGTWGYINGVAELMQQIEEIRGDDSSSDFTLDHVVFATGSGGTATGIAVGLSLAYGSLGVGHPAVLGKSPPQVHAIGVCDNPDYFYRTMSSIADEMGIKLPDDTATEKFIREIVTVQNGKGGGYAFSSDEELDFILRFAIETGIALDPVYTGKALYHFFKEVLEVDPEAYRDKSILFWHTGGSIGLYEKGDDLLDRLSLASHVIRIDPSMLNNETSGGDS